MHCTQTAAASLTIRSAAIYFGRHTHGLSHGFDPHESMPSHSAINAAAAAAAAAHMVEQSVQLQQVYPRTRLVLKFT